MPPAAASPSASLRDDPSTRSLFPTPEAAPRPQSPRPYSPPSSLARERSARKKRLSEGSPTPAARSRSGSLGPEEGTSSGDARREKTSLNFTLKKTFYGFGFHMDQRGNVDGYVYRLRPFRTEYSP
jgi:hypothetical protein